MEMLSKFHTNCVAEQLAKTKVIAKRILSMFDFASEEDCRRIKQILIDDQPFPFWKLWNWQKKQLSVFR